MRLNSLINNRGGGYRPENFQKYFADRRWIATTGGGLQDVCQWDNDNKKYTDTVIAKALDLYVEGAGFQRVKFPTSFSLANIEELSEVELINPVACEVRGNVYVKADGLKEAN
uniref:Uncharacterized protein n=1 Tax=Limosilactobacillus vaginalis TaxID=1633 RepID=A0A0F7G2L2_9LACO|nr:hypothetical protein [Limosilactobacillus vaginalis]